MNIKLQKASKNIIIFLIMMLLTFCMLSINTIKVSAHDAYFLGIAYDSDSKRYIGTISFQSNSVIGDNHAECGVSTEFYKIDFNSSNNFKIPTPDYDNITSDTDLQDAWETINKKDFENDKELLFSFPGFHTKGIITEKLDANGADGILVERVCNTLIPQLNACLDFIITESGKTPTANEVRTIAAKLVNAVDTTNANGNIAASEDIAGTTVKFSKLDENNKDDKKVLKDRPEGITKDDYVKVTINGKSGYFIYQCWKGYSYPKTNEENSDISKDNAVHTKSDSKSMQKDPYARDTSQGNWYKKVADGNSVYKIGWDAIVGQAHFNLDVMGVQFSNLGDILPTSALISAVASLCDWAITGIRSFLGLYALDELMLNQGTREISYTMGLFPNGWVGPIYLMYVVCTMIAWGIMGFAIIRIFMKRQLATINVGEKMNIMNELKNLVICCFLLGAFPFVFNMLARINNSLVSLFGSTTEFSKYMNSFYSLSQVNLGSILACFFGLALQIYFNFFYILRAITIAILYAIAPLCIYTVVLGGKHSKVFGAWMKELLSNIFVQTIHALMIAFFTSVSAISGLKTFESLVVLYSFIPLTKFVKQNVFQSGDGIGGAAAGLSSGFKNTAAGFASGLAGGGGGGGSSKGNSSGGSSGGAVGGAFSGGTGIAADRMAKSNDKSRAPRGNSFKDNAELTGNKANSVLANWSNGQNASGTGSTNKVAQKIGRVAANASNLYDKANGYSNASNIIGKDKKPVVNPNLKMQWAARPDKDGNIKIPGAGLSVPKNIAKNAISAAGTIIGSTAMAGMALGTASYDEANGSRMMRNTASFAGSHLSKSAGGVYSSFKNDKELKQYLRNNGVVGWGSNGQQDCAVMNMKVKKDNAGNVLGLDEATKPLTMSEKEFEQHDKIYKAFNGIGNMSADERTYWVTKAQSRGLDYAREGDNLAITIDKNNAQYQRNGLEMLHSSYAPYVPKQTRVNETSMGGGRSTEPIPEGFTEHAVDNSEKTIIVPNSSSRPQTNPNLTHQQILRMEQNGYTQPGTSVKEQMQHRNERKNS